MGSHAALDPWKKLNTLRAKAGLTETPNVPPSAFTIAQYCKRFGVCDKTARCQLDAMVRRGELKTGRRMSSGADGRRVLVRVYWVVK